MENFNLYPGLCIRFTSASAASKASADTSRRHPSSPTQLPFKPLLSALKHLRSHELRRVSFPHSLIFTPIYKLNFPPRRIPSLVAQSSIRPTCLLPESSSVAQQPPELPLSSPRQEPPSIPIAAPIFSAASTPLNPKVLSSP